MIEMSAARTSCAWKEVIRQAQDAHSILPSRCRPMKRDGKEGE